MVSECSDVFHEYSAVSNTYIYAAWSCTSTYFYFQVLFCYPFPLVHGEAPILCGRRRRSERLCNHHYIICTRWYIVRSITVYPPCHFVCCRYVILFRESLFGFRALLAAWIGHHIAKYACSVASITYVASFSLNMKSIAHFSKIKGFVCRM
jgi:hypothetical protein